MKTKSRKNLKMNTKKNREIKAIQMHIVENIELNQAVRQIEDIIYERSPNYKENEFIKSLKCDVPDVVEILDGENKGAYFCDSLGFKKIDFDTSAVCA